MSTRASIIVRKASNRFARIYTHWDGYPDHHGPILLDHYTEQGKIDQLIALGDLSSLGPEIGEKHDFNRQPGTAEYTRECNAYGRDRDEKNVAATFHKTLKAACEAGIRSGAEFVYFWDGQIWHVGVPEKPGEFVPLREFMKGEQTLDQTVKAFGGNLVIGKATARARAVMD